MRYREQTMVLFKTVERCHAAVELRGPICDFTTPLKGGPLFCLRGWIGEKYMDASENRGVKM